MSNLFYGCTRENPLGRPLASGLLGQGALPWPEVVAGRTFLHTDVGGEYGTDDLSAATLLAIDLAEPDTEASPGQTLDDLGLLVMLFAKLKENSSIAAKELAQLQKHAEAIPVIGPLLFSSSNLPGTLASVGGMLHATWQTRRVADLLKVSSAIKREIVTWSNDRSRGISRALKRPARKRVKVTYRNGRAMLKIRAATLAPYYNLRALAYGRHIYIPANSVEKTLRGRVGPNPGTYGTRGLGRVFAGSAAGAALAFGPQAIIDAQDSKSVKEFVERSAYSQVGNVAAFGAGMAVAAIVSGPVVVVLGLSLVAGAAAQYLVGETGLDTYVGTNVKKILE